MKYLAIILLCCATAFGANTPSRVVEFDKDQPCCKLVWTEGMPYFFINDGDIHVGIGAPTYTAFDKRLYSILVYVKNDGQGMVDVDPELFSVFARDPAYIQMAKIDIDELSAKDKKHSTYWNNFRSNMFSGLASLSGNRTANVQYSDGTSATVTYKDPEASARAVQNVREGQAMKQEKIDKQYSETVSLVLRHNTISKGVDVVGSVSFRGPKTMKPFGKGTQIDHVDIPVAGTIYRFR